jgi:prolyl-tRNA synthetase
LRIIADPALRGRFNMVTGANHDDRHLRGVDVERDIAVDQWLGVRLTRLGDPCIQCGSPVQVRRSIEVGHIFKLGTKYAEALGATVVDEHGEEREIWMGSYGIGVGRNVAAIVESSHDEKGIIWPVSVAPYEVVVTPVTTEDAPTVEVAETIYAALGNAGIDVILDDRAERPGVKFADAELVGIPYRVTVGPKGLASGEVEITRRRDGFTESVATGQVVDKVVAAIVAERR